MISLNDKKESNSISHFAPTFILLVWIIFFFNGLFSLPLMPPDEPKYAYASYRMLESGDYITPYFNCKPRFDKPPLIYWLITLSYRAFGVVDWAARIPSLLATLGVMVVIFQFALKEFGSREAIVAVIIFSNIIHVWVMGRAVAPEMVLVFFETLGIYLFYYGMKEQKRGFILGGYLALALAFLTKGPVGVIIPAGVLFLYFWYERGFFNSLKKLISIKGILLFCIVGFPWYIYMIKIHGYRYFQEFFLYHNIYRFTGKARQHPFGFYYYIPIFLGALYLWLPFTYQTIQTIKDIVKSRQKELFFLFWIGFAFLFFTVSVNKLHNYILIVYPPVALILSKAIVDSEIRTKWIKIGFLVSLIVEVGATFVMPFSVKEYYPFLFLGGISLIFLSLVIIRSSLTFKRLLSLTICKGLVMLLIFTFYIAEYKHGVRPAQLFIQIETKYGENDPVYFYRVVEQDLVYYSRQCIPTIQTLDELKEILKKKKEILLLARQGDLKELKKLKMDESIPFRDIKGRNMVAVEMVWR